MGSRCRRRGSSINQKVGKKNKQKDLGSRTMEAGRWSGHQAQMTQGIRVINCDPINTWYIKTRAGTRALDLTRTRSLVSLSSLWWSDGDKNLFREGLREKREELQRQVQGVFWKFCFRGEPRSRTEIKSGGEDKELFFSMGEMIACLEADGNESHSWWCEKGKNCWIISQAVSGDGI